MSQNCNTCPCWCVGTHTPPPTTCKKGDCIKLGYILVKPSDSVGPCGQQGKVSLKCFDFSACCNSSELYIDVVHNSAPNKLVVNSIDKNELIFTTTEEAEPYDKIVLTIKAKCCHLGDFGEITIFIKDLCECVNCNSQQICNKCTAECENKVGDLILTSEGELNTQNQSGLSLS